MNCDDVRNLLDAYVDAELDLVTSLEIERHLASCADCSRMLHNRRALREAMRSDVLYFQAPPKLYRQVQASIGQADTPNLADWLRRNTWVGMAAALLVGVIVTAGLFQNFSGVGRANALAQDVLDSHIRSLMVDHLEDVQSTDHNTV